MQKNECIKINKHGNEYLACSADCVLQMSDFETAIEKPISDQCPQWRHVVFTSLSPPKQQIIYLIPW